MKNNKLNKIILLTVILSMIFTMSVSAIVFTDISRHWAEDYIERVAKNGLIKGYPDKTFKPDNNVTVLEALVMMSSLYDIDEDLKEEIIEKYEPVIKNMPNTLYNEWAFDYLAIILELGIVSENGMKNMFAAKTIFNEATREEVAVLLAKAMMLELKNVYILPYDDYLEIDKDAKPYIYILYDKKIMQGNNNKINPKDLITRAEIATLMGKAFDYIEENDVYPDLDDYVPTTVVEGIVSKLSDEKAESYIYIKNNNEVESIVKINNETEIFVNGRAREFSDLEEDMLVKCKIDENRLAIKIEADNSKEVVRGKISLVAYAQPASVTIIDEDKDKIKYNVPSDTDVYLDGKEVELKNLRKNDEITLLLENDKVYQINAISRIKHYDGEITSIDYSAFPIKVSIKTDKDELKTFTFNSDIEVTRNDEESSFDRVRVGDEVTITTEYDDMIAIDTVAKEAEINGTIKEILIGTVNKIKIADKDGNVEQYSVSNNVVITIGDKNASLNDLRVGYNINVNTSGDEIVTIEASEIQAATNFTGKILVINKTDKIVMMQNLNSNGQTELIYLKVTNNTKIFNMSGETKYFNDLEEGKNILSTAISQSGEYIALSIFIQ